MYVYKRVGCLYIWYNKYLNTYTHTYSCVCVRTYNMIVCTYNMNVSVDWYRGIFKRAEHDELLRPMVRIGNFQVNIQVCVRIYTPIYTSVTYISVFTHGYIIKSKWVHASDGADRQSLGVYIYKYMYVYTCLYVHSWPISVFSSVYINQCEWLRLTVRIGHLQVFISTCVCNYTLVHTHMMCILIGLYMHRLM